MFRTRSSFFIRQNKRTGFKPTFESPFVGAAETADPAQPLASHCDAL
ncbi:hypothetical protein J5226_21010 [Lysobacter sp. K5869]|nr:hypothetical protein [Lysobacter sp. K5869]QWP76051.1 hypothetical protein J5226_21010 [Lysobacter sp. K5869]